MGDLDLRRLRYFLVLAEELNYGRAADALRIAQPALSRSIAALERELGVTLFERSRSGTRLAAAGELLRDDARELLHAAETLQRRVRLADREGRSLRVGFMPGLIVTPVVRRLEERWPGLRVDVLRTSWTEQIQALRDGRFDASFARRPFDDEGLTVIDLYAEPRVAVLPVDHPRAGADEVLLADLTGDLLLQPPGFIPEWRGAAEPPTTSPTVEEKLELIAAGRGIVILPASTTRYYHRPDVTYARVIDLADTTVCLAIETRRESPVLRDLVRIARTVPPSDFSGQVGEAGQVADAGQASVAT
ncbi:LysR family transcriptional regulator [Winogradskya humida]|uniref:LysR family transcriptional regulator n=1 Tax=Winogradskya humida TaxID=113566 RepID=A0ABQ3ZTB6_9ACTN|nr:LysR substrate-binding domain-containing protein [Actinoplanes humidus]GIE21792.1 LysR family transcriptional regulator [Actinoplanes humidus]